MDRKILIVALCVAAVVLGLLLIAAFTGNDSEEAVQEAFNAYIQEYFETIRNRSYLLTNSGAYKFSQCGIEIEQVKYGEYHIIATMGESAYGCNEIWEIPLARVKEEMRTFAEGVILFAKEQKMDNDYYLYIELSDCFYITFVYDYEKDVLYYPEDYELYRKMYTLFGTTSEYTISKTQQGCDWLVENGFGEIKHHEYESLNRGLGGSPSVYINDEGEFKAYKLYREYSQ